VFPLKHSTNGNENWHLLHTRAGKEQSLYKQLCEILPEVLLPMVKVPVRRWGRGTSALVPLFPCYLFAYFDFEPNICWIKYTRGVNKLVSIGMEPAIVPRQIIDSLKQRCACGAVELDTKALCPGETVTLQAGSFRGFEAVFEAYLSGEQRVAILLTSLGSATLRFRLPTVMVSSQQQ
jgi:transcriptional antiterminator RfaH